MDYIKDIVIPETKKRLNQTMNLSEYFRVIGCRLIVACYVGHSVRDFFLKVTITSQKGVLICINKIIYGRRLDKITQFMSYTNISIPDFNELGFCRHLGSDMVDNTLGEGTEAGGVDGIQLRARRGILGDHEIVITPKYCEKWLVDKNKWRGVKQPYQIQICNNQSSD